MNERIKELAEQAGFQINPLKGMIFLEGLNPTADLKLEKFAELIVQECINKITTYDLVPGHSAKWEDIYDIHARLLQDLAEDLKEHFRIEE